MTGQPIIVYMADWRILAATLVLAVLTMLLSGVLAILWMFRKGQ